MPSPRGAGSATASYTRTPIPAWCRLSARVRPPMPAPAMITSILLALLFYRSMRRLASRRPMSGETSPLRGAEVLDGLEGREFHVRRLASDFFNLPNVDVVDD